jgi:hypothetical protein
MEKRTVASSAIRKMKPAAEEVSLEGTIAFSLDKTLKALVVKNNRAHSSSEGLGLRRIV